MLWFFLMRVTSRVHSFLTWTPVEFLSTFLIFIHTCCLKLIKTCKCYTERKLAFVQIEVILKAFWATMDPSVRSDYLSTVHFASPDSQQAGSLWSQPKIKMQDMQGKRQEGREYFHNSLWAQKWWDGSCHSVFPCNYTVFYQESLKLSIIRLLSTDWSALGSGLVLAAA